MSAFRPALLFAVLAPVISIADESLTIAVASNFQATAGEIAAEFTEATKIPVRISTGSTGKLYTQILNGAPYDLFLAADAARPKLLEDHNAAVRGSRVTYAIGSLVLWSADSALKGDGCLQALENGAYRHLAIANPLTAPYGIAAKEFLQASGTYDDASSRLVYGENISQTLHFVASGNATLGLIALSQVAGDLPVTASCSWNVPNAMYSAIEQQAVILSASTHLNAAKQFLDFLQAPQTVAILEDRGYTVPQ